MEDKYAVGEIMEDGTYAVAKYWGSGMIERTIST